MSGPLTRFAAGLLSGTAALLGFTPYGLHAQARMNEQERRISTASELSEAAASTSVRHIIATESLSGLRSLRLSPGRTLTGDGAGVTLRFAPGEDGVQLSSDDTVENIEVHTDLSRRALFNDTQVGSLGRLVLRNVRTVGAIRLLGRDQVRSGHVEVENVDVQAADVRSYGDRPKGYGVEVIPGAFVLWNQQADRSVSITADLIGLTAGRAGAPVRGSGIFVSGAGENGGRLLVRRLETDAVYSDGGIAPGTSDRISGGVFVVYGAFVDRLCTRGPITTYGANDMVLDNWGTVGQWTAQEKITSQGPSGIGFVNFGTVDVLEIKSTIETFGQGSRGFNVYAGTVHRADFERIVTHADGAVGIQISQPVGAIRVHRGIETYGGIGDSLIKGVVVKLAAIALSVKPGGSARSITVEGGLVTHGTGVVPLELHGNIERLAVSEGLAATGGGFDKL
jgi:hypothetical protein